MKLDAIDDVGEITNYATGGWNWLSGRGPRVGEIDTDFIFKCNLLIGDVSSNLQHVQKPELISALVSAAGKLTKQCLKYN